MMKCKGKKLIGCHQDMLLGKINQNSDSEHFRDTAVNTSVKSNLKVKNCYSFK